MDARAMHGTHASYTPAVTVQCANEYTVINIHMLPN